jgi:hypothetical protein
MAFIIEWTQNAHKELNAVYDYFEEKITVLSFFDNRKNANKLKI